MINNDNQYQIIHNKKNFIKFLLKNNKISLNKYHINLKLLNIYGVKQNLNIYIVS